MEQQKVTKELMHTYTFWFCYPNGTPEEWENKLYKVVHPDGTETSELHSTVKKFKGGTIRVNTDPKSKLRKWFPVEEKIKVTEGKKQDWPQFIEQLKSFESKSVHSGPFTDIWL